MRVDEGREGWLCSLFAAKVKARTVLEKGEKILSSDPGSGVTSRESQRGRESEKVVEGMSKNRKNKTKIKTEGVVIGPDSQKKVEIIRIGGLLNKPTTLPSTPV